jgi:hypothetical protein
MSSLVGWVRAPQTRLNVSAPTSSKVGDPVPGWSGLSNSVQGGQKGELCSGPLIIPTFIPNYTKQKLTWARLMSESREQCFKIVHVGP